MRKSTRPRRGIEKGTDGNWSRILLAGGGPDGESFGSETGVTVRRIRRQDRDRVTIVIADIAVSRGPRFGKPDAVSLSPTAAGRRTGTLAERSSQPSAPAASVNHLMEFPEVNASNARVDAPMTARRPTAGLGIGRPPAPAGSKRDEGRAARLLSETAHDLRSPLTTIREAIRIVRDEVAGPIAADQRELLSSAIDQCDCVDQLVGELVPFDRIRSGTPRIRRAWVSIRDIRHAVDETLRPWAVPRRIAILWDGADDATLSLFADLAVLRRLLVNLVSNATRATPDGGAVLIRVSRVRGGEAARFEVVDQGEGIAAGHLRELSRRQIAMSNGEGIGLAISRQLAALHFSTLRIRSRVGVGTEVAFEVPACGPRSVAECWARWRSGFLPESRRPAHRSRPPHRRGDAPVPASPQRFRPNEIVEETLHTRIDPPAMSVELTHDGPDPKRRDRMVAGTVSLGGAAPRNAADEFDKILQADQRMYDLIYRLDQRHWVWFFDADVDTAEERTLRVNETACAGDERMRLHWSRPHMIPIDPHQMPSRVLDWLIRQSLSVATSVRTNDHDVRLGTEPISQSPMAEARLDEQIRRVGWRTPGRSEPRRRHASSRAPFPTAS